MTSGHESRSLPCAVEDRLPISAVQGKIRGMALSQKRTTTQPVLNLPAENQSVPTLTPQQRRILRLLLPGDLIWEIADDPGHRTIYDEKRGCDQRLSTAMVTALEQQGWIRQRPNTQA